MDVQSFIVSYHITFNSVYNRNSYTPIYVISQISIPLSILINYL